LSGQAQTELTELVLWAEVDRIISKRLRLPTYANWRRKRLRTLERYRTPEHWGLQPDEALVRAIAHRADTHVLIVGGSAVSRTALYLAAHGCEVTALGGDEQIVEQVRREAEDVGLAARLHGHVADLGSWAHGQPLDALVCGSDALARYPIAERARLIALLQGATSNGGVHLVDTAPGARAMLSLEELATCYSGWNISIERGANQASMFLARKSVA